MIKCYCPDFLYGIIRLTVNRALSKLNSSLNHTDKITIMLADDHPLLRQALRNLLEKQPDFEIVAEVADGEEAVRLANELIPDVIIMDIGMPKLNGLEATRQIKVNHPETAILVLTVYSDSEHVFEILEAGAAGYLTKSVFGEEVLNAIRGVSAGEMVLSAAVSQQVLKYALRYKIKPLPVNARENLTARELGILKLAAIGMSNKDIASKLGISQPTVKGYLVNIFSKLQVGSRTEAVITGLRAGYITLDDLE